MKKQIILTPILEFGGSNSYLKLLIEYFGKKNVVLVLDHEQHLENLRRIDPDKELEVKLCPSLQGYASYRKGAFKLNLKVILLSIRSIFIIFFLSMRNGFSGVTISVIYQEKHLYLLWLPFIKVHYVLHSTPYKTENIFTTFTCNNRLGQLKKIITVSKANRNLIISRWGITKAKERFVCVIYNCLLKRNSKSAAISRNIENKFLITTMGHVADYKNPFFWLEVAKLVVRKRQNVFFYWLGSGALLETFQQKTNNIEEINFIGAIEDTNSFLDKSAIYYQPSLEETQGISVIEAMSNKLPCVVSSVGGLPESVINNLNGFVVSPHNLKENVDAIVKLIDNKELHSLFGIESYKRYQQLFIYEEFKLEMDKTYLS